MSRSPVRLRPVGCGALPFTGTRHKVRGIGGLPPNLNPAPGKIAISQSGAYPGGKWIAEAIEVNGGTSEDWRLNIGVYCGKVADG